MKYEKAEAEKITFSNDSFCFIGSYNSTTCPNWTVVEGIGNCVDYVLDSFTNTFTCSDYDDWQEWDITKIGNDTYCKDYWP